MTVQTIPYALQNSAHSAALFRQAFSAAWGSGGVCDTGELAVAAQSTPNMTVQVAAGRAVVAGTQVANPSGFIFNTQGDYFVLNDASVSVTVSAANATNPRIDAVYIGVQDSFYSGGTNTAVLGIVAGTPAASPVAPAIPSNAILLANIAVAANATSIVNANITNANVLAALANVPYATAAGLVTVAAAGLTTVTFPAGRFSVPPIVTTMNVNTGGALSYTFMNSLSTVSNFAVRVFNSSGTQIAGQAYWTATQMTPTTAAG